MRRLIYWSLGVVGLLIAGAVTAVLVIDWHGRAEQLLTAAVGRDVRLGSLDIDPGWTTTVTVEDLSVANTEWAAADTFVTLDRGHVAVRIWPLITGRMELPEIVLRAPKIALEKDAEGRVNWNFASGAETAGEAVAPDERREFPVVGRLVIEDGRLSYRDATRALELDGKIATAKAVAGGEDTLDLSLDGTLEGRPVSLAFTGGSMVQLRETEQPYPVDFKLGFAKTNIRAEGTVTNPFQLAGLDIDLSVEGPTLADGFSVLQIPVPDTPPYSLEGALAKDGKRWRFENFEAVIGASDLAGWVSLDYEQTPPFVEGELVSKRLDFKDLAGLIGVEPDKPEAEQKAGKFLDTPIAAEPLHAMNMDVRFTGEQVNAPSLPLERLEFRVQLTDGRALVQPLEIAVAGGSVSGTVALNAREDVPSADADLAFDRLNLKPFFRDSQFVQEMGGHFSGDIYILGVGRTLDEMMGTSRGEGFVAMRDGSVSGLLVEAAGLDVFEALSLVIGEDARVRIRCGRVDVEVKEGTMNFKQAIVDTTDSLLIAQGDLDLGEKAFRLQIEARAKDFSLIDAAAPVRISGSFTDPSVAIGGVDFLPFFEMGEQENLNCDAVVDGTIEQRLTEGDGN